LGYKTWDCSRFFELKYIQPGKIQNDIQTLTPQQMTLNQVLTNANNNRITFSLLGGVIVCPIVQCITPTLASSLGKLDKTSSFLAPDDDLVLLKSKVITQTRLEKFIREQNISSNSFVTGNEVEEDVWNKFVQSSAQISGEYTKNLLDPTLTTNESQFLAKLANIFKNYQEKKKKLTQNEIRQITIRCIQNKYWSSIKLLVRENSLSCNLVPHLIENLIENHQVEILVDCLHHFYDIPEKIIIYLIQYFISHAPRDLMVAAYKKKNFNTPELAKQMALSKILNLIMHRNFRHSIFRACVKLITIKEIGIDTD